MSPILDYVVKTIVPCVVTAVYLNAQHRRDIRWRDEDIVSLIREKVELQRQLDNIIEGS